MCVVWATVVFSCVCNVYVLCCPLHGGLDDYVLCGALRSHSKPTHSLEDLLGGRILQVTRIPHNHSMHHQLVVHTYSQSLLVQNYRWRHSSKASNVVYHTYASRSTWYKEQKKSLPQKLLQTTSFWKLGQKLWYPQYMVMEILKFCHENWFDLEAHFTNDYSPANSNFTLFQSTHQILRNIAFHKQGL